jgi:hypothetical protein
MSKIKAEGCLRHGFFGDYVAVIALMFQDERAAKDALNVLAGNWKVSNKNTKGLIWSGSSEELKEVKSQLDKFKRTNRPCGYHHCDDKCKSAEIDSINHSIDFGPRFDIEIECEPEEQTSMFG